MLTTIHNPNRKSAFVIALAASTMLLGTGYAARAFAYEVPQARHRFRQEFDFRLGICVGQALAQQGISLPTPAPGEPPQLDSSTEASVQAAVEECRAEFQGASVPVSPSPAPAPSSSPSAPGGDAPTSSPTTGAGD